MSDAELHGVACLQKIVVMCESARGDAEDLAGWIRKIHQTAGYGLSNMKAVEKAEPQAEPSLITPKVQAAMEKMKRAAAEKHERIRPADTVDPAGDRHAE